MPSMKKSRKFAFLALMALFLLTGGTQALQAQIPNPGVGLPSPENLEAFSPPIPLGVSGGNAGDLGKTSQGKFCCSGTLGCLVTDGTKQYILSNNHVLAKTNKAAAGSPIIYPGLIDVGCFKNQATVVAKLSKKMNILFGGATNVVDAAIAKVVTGMVNPSGTIDLIGTVSSAVLSNPPLGTRVKKSGRTSGLTFGTVDAVGVSLNVNYNKSCASCDIDGKCQVAFFDNQLMFNSGTFIQSGDSGSLVVTDPVSGCPKPVGLVFAGSDTAGFANPIQAVLDTFGVTMVGTCTGDTAAAMAPEAQATAAQAAEVTRLVALKKRHHEVIFKVLGVVGTGVGLHPDTKSPVIEIYVEKDTPEVRQRLPQTLDGAPVQIIETGKVRAL